jgi:hypothetical protein
LKNYYFFAPQLQDALFRGDGNISYGPGRLAILYSYPKYPLVLQNKEHDWDVIWDLFKRVFSF